MEEMIQKIFIFMNLAISLIVNSLGCNIKWIGQ